MKLEIDTMNDSVDELNKTIAMLQEAIEKRTGSTSTGKRVQLRPTEINEEEPKIIFEDILEKPSKTTIPVPKEKLNVKKRKVLKQDEHVQKEEEEDEDRYLPKIQYKDFW